jgi:hypothetical protein
MKTSISRNFPFFPASPRPPYTLFHGLHESWPFFKIFKGPNSKNQLISEAGDKKMNKNRRKGTKMEPGGKTGGERL